MNDELNQTQTAEEEVDFGIDAAEEDLFDDWSIDDSSTPDETEDEDPDSEVTESKEEPAAEAPVEDFLTIKYNKESKGLTREQAIEYAQKGMNYDNIYERYTNLKENEPIISELSKLAKANNMSVNDYVKGLVDVQSSFELNKEVETLKAQYPSSDASLLEELAKERIAKRQSEESVQASKGNSAREAEINRQLDIFYKRYPDVDPAKLDAGVYQLMKDNYTLLEAYEIVNADKREQLAKEEAAKQAIAQKNQSNREKALGNISNRGIADEDEFLKELFSD